MTTTPKDFKVKNGLQVGQGGSFGGAVTVGTPTSANHATTKTYVDNLIEGLKVKAAVEAATTTNLSATYNNGTSGVGATLTSTSNGVFPSIDGHNGWVLNDRVLIKNQSTALQNGIYVITDLGTESTPWVLTRCQGCDESSEVPGSYVFVKTGTINASTGWVAQVSNIDTFVIGTDAITWVQFTGGGTAYTFSTGLSVAGSTVTVDQTVIAPLASPTFTGTVTLPSTTSIGDISSTELSYLNNTTSNIQSQLDGKSPIAGSTSITTVGTVTNATSPTAAGSTGLRNITISTSEPTGGLDGDVWLVYQ